MLLIISFHKNKVGNGKKQERQKKLFILFQDFNPFYEFFCYSFIFFAGEITSNLMGNLLFEKFYSSLFRVSEANKKRVSQTI